jgi:hypothetical protein
MKAKTITEKQKRFIINNVVAFKTYFGFPFERLSERIRYSDEEMDYIRSIWELVPDYQTTILRKDLDRVYDECMSVN